MINNLVQKSIMNFLKNYKNKEYKIIFENISVCSFIFNGITNTNIMYYKILNVMVYEFSSCSSKLQLILNYNENSYTVNINDYSIQPKSISISIKNKLSSTEEECFQSSLVDVVYFSLLELEQINELYSVIKGYSGA